MKKPTVPKTQWVFCCRLKRHLHQLNCTPFDIIVDGETAVTLCWLFENCLANNLLSKTIELKPKQHLIQ
jgi:hypothetical protein